MSTATLEQIEAQHITLGKQIAELKAARPTVLALPSASIELAAGERYAGAILNADGTIDHHVILLSGDHVDIDWPDAKAWAEKLGGTLPTRREQSLLFTNLKDQFEEAWYWSSEEYPSNTNCAFVQDFTNGSQDYDSKSASLRARAVRRLTA